MFKLSAYFMPFRKELLWGPFFKLIEAILELLLPTLLAYMIQHGVAEGNRSVILWLGTLMLIMSMLGYGCSLICQYYAARASQGFGTLLRNALFRHISSLSYADLDRFGTPSLMNRLISDVNQLQVAMAMLIRLVIRAPFICIGAIIMSMLLDFRLSVILIGATLVLALIIWRISAAASPLYHACQSKLDRITRIVGENLSGVRVIRAFAGRSREEQRFAEASEDWTRTVLRVGKISALLSPLTMLVLNAGIVLALWYGGFRIGTGGLTQGKLIAFIQYITQMLLALIVVSNLIVLFTKASACASRVREVLETAPFAPETAAEPLMHTTGRPETGIPAIRFHAVDYAYASAPKNALTGIDFTIMPGEKVGIIGGTGSGKSTLAALIPRFYDISHGVLEIDGLSVEEYPLHALRRKIGYVQQKTLLFRGSIMDNIRYGHESAGEDEILEAARIAQADAFIREWPEGYSTLLDQGGKNLSGGQKQRLAIARAIVGRPDILILDDAFSALDYKTESQLRRAMMEEHGMTVLMISQRVSTIRHADKIIVLDQGSVTGIGTHEELLRTNQLYREICSSQQEAEVALS
ncbi:ABC transporter ATP-binding protein [Gorillibacterium sp. sgz5001074]|uniref:ABC transporter ATP-binding protein n=1 Tax=Gorillibacterium sp. sgz5001074 TaxID=3446695 RepID=UPI003F66DF13